MNGYRSPSTGRFVRAVLFDTFGTVVDWRSGIAAAVEAFAHSRDVSLDPVTFAVAWRAKYQPAMERVRSGAREFTTLDVLHRENLEFVLQDRGFDIDDLPEAELDALSKSWRWLPPWPDSVPGITALKTNFVVGPLSNGNTALLVDMAKFAGLGWDVVLGSDVLGAYKPDPVAYRASARLLGLEPGEVMLAAAHNGDLGAARGAGLATAFISRPAEHGPGQTSDLTPDADWDCSTTSITELAQRLTW